MVIYNLFYSLYKNYGENMCVVNIHYKEITARILQRAKEQLSSSLLSIGYFNLLFFNTQYL